MQSIVEFPDLLLARQLMNTVWSNVEIQKGRFSFKSEAWPGAWSVSSLRVRAQNADILIFGNPFLNSKGEEAYAVRFASVTDKWASDHLATARPGFKIISDTPSQLSALTTFQTLPPSRLRIGLGAPSPQELGSTVTPILWCCYAAADYSLMLYADQEIPLNIALIADGYHAGLIRKKLSSLSVVEFPGS